MNEQPAHPAAEERALVLVVAGFALFNALASTAVLAGLSFRTLCIAYAVGLPVVAFALLRFGLPGQGGAHGRVPGSDSGPLWGLLALCFVSAFLALIVHRPNLDDAYYFGGRTIHFLEHPEAIVDLVQHQRALLDWPAEYPLVLLQHVSLLWAFVAWAFGISGLAAIHTVAPVVGGLMLPLAWHALIARFASRRAAVVGVAAVMACLALDGAITNGFGWFGFPALRLGKGLLMMIGVPLFVAWSKDWFDQPCAANFAKLALLATACAGWSDSALFLLPVLAVFVVAGAAASRGIADGAAAQTLRRVVGFGAALVWMLGTGLYILAVLDRGEMADLGFGYGFPDNFADQFAFVFGAPPGFFFWLYLGSLAATGFTLRRHANGRFLLGWSAAALLVLNPWLFELITRTMTSYNGYWRLFYLLPLLPAVGIVTALAAERLARSRPRVAAIGVASVLVVTGLATAVGPFADKAIFANSPLGLGGAKIDPEVAADAAAIMAAATPGPMLAPLVYSQTIPLYSARFPQVSVRGYMLRHTAARNGAARLAANRLAAVEYVTVGQPPIGRAGLVALLRNEDLVNVVVVAAREAELAPLMERHGFAPAASNERFALFVRR